MLDHGQCGAGLAALQAGLQHPDLAHVGTQLAAARDVADAGIKHRVHRLLQRWHRVCAVGLPLLPAGQHVMPQQAGQQEAGRHRLVLAHPPVGIGQGLADEGLFLRVFFGRAARGVKHRVQHRKDAAVQVEALQHRHAGQRVAGLQQLDHLVKQPRDRHVGQQRRGLGNRRTGGGLKLEPQLGGKTHRADDAHRVFAVARGGVADQAQHPRFDIGQAAVVVHHHLGLGVVIHRVDGEIAARRVLDLRPPDVVAQHPAAGVHRMGRAGQRGAAGLLVATDLCGLCVVHVGAEGGHLNHLMVAPAAVDDMHDAEAPADDERAPEQRFHLLRCGVGGHVKVFGAQAHQQVTHRAAHHVGLVAGLLQGAHHLDGALVHQRGVNVVGGHRHLHPPAGGHGAGAGRLNAGCRRVGRASCGACCGGARVCIAGGPLAAGFGGRPGRCLARRGGSRCSGQGCCGGHGGHGGHGDWGGGGCRRGRHGRGRLAGLAKQPVNEFFDHANNLRMRQLRAWAIASSAGLGLVATGSCTISSSGRSLVESL